MSKAVRARFERLVAEAAFLGAAAAYVVLVVHWLGTYWQTRWSALPDHILVAVMGSGLGLLFEPIDLLVLRRGYLALPLLAVLLAWRPTRRPIVVVLRVLVMIEVARLVALSCFSVYVMNRALGLLSVPLALVPTVWLTRRRSWPILSLIVVALGLCIGALWGIIFQHDYPVIVSPLQRFVPTMLVTLFIAWLISTRTTDAPSANTGRFRRLWGLSALCVSCTMIVVVMTDWLWPRNPPPDRFLSDSSYDLLITGEPPVLVWTDTEQLHVLTNPYGETHESYVVAAAQNRTPQRIWPSPTDGFYVQMQYAVGWWKAAPSGAPIAPAPTVEYRHEAWQDGSPGALAEDPATATVFIVNQFGSHYVMFDRDSAAARASGHVSTAFLSLWYSSANLPARALHVSSALGEGGVYEVNLDTMAIERKAAMLYVYETVLDPDRHILWGARPITGDVVGIDTETFDVRYRFRTEWGSRDIKRDPRTGALYTCSLPGHVFRIDVDSGTVATIGWCGRLCRNLFLDSARDTLWATTDDGICRIPLAAAGDRGTGAADGTTRVLR